jgi:hypothetical protein
MPCVDRAMSACMCSIHVQQALSQHNTPSHYVVAAVSAAAAMQQVVGFEQGPQPGGTWVYDTTTDSDVLGAATSRRRVHGSMYRDLRTNLPREIMGYTDVPFTPAFMGTASRDPRRYPGHSEVCGGVGVRSVSQSTIPGVAGGPACLDDDAWQGGVWLLSPARLRMMPPC